MMYVHRLTGPGYQWFGTFALMDPTAWTDSNGNTIPKYLSAFQNVVGVMPAFDATRPAVSAFFNAYQQHPLVSQFSSAAGKSPNILALLAYDAVFAFANAWNQSIEVPIIILNSINLFVVVCPS